MNFKCEELTISDDPEFGCTITFSDTKDKEDDENQTIEEWLNPQGKYLLMQRSYPEEFDEDDFYTLETSESNIELDYRDKILINMNKQKIKIQWSSEEVEIGLQKLDEEEYHYLEKILKERFIEKVMIFLI